MTFMLPEYCFTPEQAADFKKRGERHVKKGVPGGLTMRICGYTAALPPMPLADGSKPLYFPAQVAVFQVYTRDGRCVGAAKNLWEAKELMSKRGRNAGHKMHVCVDYSPPLPYTPIIARVCIARIGRQLAQSLYVQRDNENDSAEAA